MQPKEIRAKWEPHVGKFVLSFTAIEHLVTITIDLLSNRSASKTTKTLLFEKRTELLLELLYNSKNISEENKLEFSNLLKQALSLSKNVRNIISHNHVLIELYQNNEDGELHESEYIFSSRNRSKKLSLANLTNSAIEAERLAEEGFEIYLAILKEHFSNS